MDTTHKRNLMHRLADETVEHYKDHPRSLLRIFEDCGSVCAYNGEDGAHCAVGRFLRPEIKEEREGLYWNTRDIAFLHEIIASPDSTEYDHLADIKSFDELLHEEVRGLTFKFWKSLQTVHDDGEFWDEDDGKFTDEGKEYVEKFHNFIEEGYYD